VVLVGIVLVRGAWRAEGASRLALAGFGGVWLGYQLQSLISFDVPPLALLHWLSAGVIVALAAPPRWREVSLPGQAARAVKRKGKGKAPGGYVVPASTRVLQGAIALLALAAVWLTAYPLRADLVAASAAPLAASGGGAEAITRLERAADLNPSEPSYPLLAARGYEAAGRRDLALTAAEEAARRDPGTVGYALFAAQQARLSGMQAEAVRYYRETVERDPLDPIVLNEAAGYLLEGGQVDEAALLAERSADLRAEAGTLVLLGQAKLAQQDTDAARAAAEQALAIDPASETAKRLLSQIINGL
jgi:tetratricopeptide (TPR) repeat protein